MPLTIAERRYRLPRGATKEIAAEAGVSVSWVSAVVNETYQPRTDDGVKKMRRIRVLIARKLGMRVDEAFPPKVVEPVEQIAGVA